MKLEVITPDANLFAGEVKRVQLPGLDGLFEVLENHAPMIAALKSGQLIITDTGGKQHQIEINGGFSEILQNKMVVLVESNQPK